MRPAPKAANRMVSPDFTRFARTASSMAIGIEAAEVFPTRSTFTYTRFGSIPNRTPTASMIRRFAWWGTNRST